MKRVIRLAAADDIAQALGFYATRGRRLATDFIAEIDHALRLIEGYPQLGPRVVAGYRRIPLSRFPYFVYYRIDAPKRVIEVVAVTHQSRRPNFWRARIEEAVAEYLLPGRAAC